ncbi:MAG: hypothetical protein ABI885_28255 [Gammaproteobacteria bacterium]
MRLPKFAVRHLVKQLARVSALQMTVPHELRERGEGVSCEAGRNDVRREFNSDRPEDVFQDSGTAVDPRNKGFLRILFGRAFDP